MNFSKFVIYNLSLLLICSNFSCINADEQQNTDISEKSIKPERRWQLGNFYFYPDSNKVEKKSDFNLIDIDKYEILKILYYEFIKNKNEKEIKLLWPVEGFTCITSHFDDKENRTSSHGAIDIAGYGIFGASVRAPIDMIITYASYGYNGGYGNLVTGAFQHNGKSYQIYFGHLSKLSATRGTNVLAGSIIGLVGNSGFSTGPHLHFEIRENGQRIDPELFAYDY